MQKTLIDSKFRSKEEWYSEAICREGKKSHSTNCPKPQCSRSLQQKWVCLVPNPLQELCCYQSHRLSNELPQQNFEVPWIIEEWRVSKLISITILTMDKKSLTNNKLSWQETFPRNWCPVWNETLPAFQCMLQGKSTGSNRPMELHNNLYKPWIGTLEHQAPNASVIRAPTNLSCHNRHCWLNSKSSSAYRVRNPQGHQDLCIKKKPHKTKAQEGKFENLWC